jgi:hypothetical protein
LSNLQNLQQIIFKNQQLIVLRDQKLEELLERYFKSNKLDINPKSTINIRNIPKYN